MVGLFPAVGRKLVDFSFEVGLVLICLRTRLFEALKTYILTNEIIVN